MKTNLNILIVGQNTKFAYVFSHFAKVYMLLDKANKNFRSYAESSSYNLISTTTDITVFSSIFRRTKELITIIKKYDINIVFTNEKISMLSAKFASFLLFRKVKLLSTSHNSYAWINNDNKVRLFSKLIDFCTDGYIALASFVNQQLISNGVSRSKILLQPNSIEYDLFKTKSNYVINEPFFKIVYVAAIYPGKGQLELLQIIKDLSSYSVNIRLDLIGDYLDPDYKLTLDKFVESNNLSSIVTFKGRLDNEFIKQHLCDYDLYVCPSYMEMSPYNILEAMAAGLPIIAHAVGGISDILDNDKNAILIDELESTRFSQAIINLMENISLREKLGRCAYLKVSTELSPDESANHLIKFLDTI